MINKNPLFSIVMATYNASKYLEEALNSIFHQNCDDYELIVIDGGSSDGSQDILRKYADKITYWISEKDNGQSNAFNKGFQKATGEFYFWLNGDDLLLPNALSNIKTAIHNNSNIKWFAGNTIFFDKNGEIKKCARGPQWCNLTFNNSILSVFGPSSVFHSQLWKKTNGFNEELHFVMDTDLWMQLMSKGYRYKQINKYLWGFRLHEQSKTSHATLSKISQAYQNERDWLKLKYNIKSIFIKKLFLKLHKIINGSHFLGIYDTYRLKGKNIRKILL